MKFRANWTWPWGPYFVVRIFAIATSCLADFCQVISVATLIIGEFATFESAPQPLLESLPVQGWSSVIPKFSAIDFISFYIQIPVMLVMFTIWTAVKLRGFRGVFVDASTVDLHRDEYVEDEVDKTEDEQRTRRMQGTKKILWRLYYWFV